MKRLFEGLSSNTLCANGNQTFIIDNEPEGIETGLIFIKIFRGGNFKYHFVFSGVIDSTFADGSFSKCNDLCDWTINSLSFAITNQISTENLSFSKITFNGNESIYVGCENYIISDSININSQKGNYICLKICFSGKKIPCHKESIIPIFRNINNEYLLCSEVPVPILTAIEFETEKNIIFAGDSITQGIGSTFNSYNNYAAVAAEIIGEKYSYWNLGLGYGRASDVSSGGIWLDKIKCGDLVIVCYGVNDILHGYKSKIKENLLNIILEAKKSGAKVLIQTIPPFDYNDINTKIWNEINEYIRTELVYTADSVFDNVPILSIGGKNNPLTKYGGHPNDEGCELWAKAIIPCIKNLL